MKIRNGHVSNSSSSSFIVGFKNIPRSVEQMKNMLFYTEKKVSGTLSHPKVGNVKVMEDRVEMVMNACGHDYAKLELDKVAETVYKDLGVKPMTEKEILKEASGRYGCDNINLYDDKYKIIVTNESGTYKDYDWDKYDKDCDEAAQSHVDEFLGKHPDCIFFEFNYADEDGPYFSELEHGNLFRNLPNMRISKH